MTDRPSWRKSSYSGTGHACVELADLGHQVAVRNSNHPLAGTLHLTAAAASRWIAGTVAGDLDDLTT